MGTNRDERGPLAQNSSQTLAANALSAGLDELDAAILRFLECHGRATNYEVGEAAGVSASAASRRIQALEASGAISGYRALVNDRLLGKRLHGSRGHSYAGFIVLDLFGNADNHCFYSSVGSMLSGEGCGCGSWWAGFRMELRHGAAFS